MSSKQFSVSIEADLLLQPTMKLDAWQVAYSWLSSLDCVSDIVVAMPDTALTLVSFAGSRYEDIKIVHASKRAGTVVFLKAPTEF